VQVIPASNLTQQVAQGFLWRPAAQRVLPRPADVRELPKDGVLDAYPGTLPNASGFASALSQAFTYKSTFTCEPKDASTLALYINTTDWQQAGLGAPPATWSQLEADAKKLTTGGRTGLTIDQTHSGIDEFFYQNGGTVTNAAGTKVELDSSQNIAALTFLKGMLNQGIMKFPGQVGAGFSGQAFGENKAAMDIIGNWGERRAAVGLPERQVQGLPAARRAVRHPRDAVIHQLLGRAEAAVQPGRRHRPREVPDHAAAGDDVRQGVRRHPVASRRRRRSTPRLTRSTRRS